MSLDPTVVGALQNRGFQLPGHLQSDFEKNLVRARVVLGRAPPRYLARSGEILPKSKAFGEAFKHFLILELRAYLSYTRKRVPLTFWRSTSQFEVDLLVGDELAIEVKATENPTDRHLKGLRALKEEGICKRYLLVCTVEQVRKTTDGIEILPWQEFLKKLWAHQMA